MPANDLRRDAALARYLHNERAVPLDQLNELVQVCRSLDGAKGLAELLVERGLLTHEQVEARIACISDIGGIAPIKLTESAEWRVPVTHWRPDGLIDEYRLIDRLGKGTMGSVYLCAHTKTGANCAMKTVKLSAPSELVERLRREGLAQARVDGHPNVVRIHGQGKAHGRCYLVMEYCPGGDLSQRLRKRGALQPTQAATLVRDLALGMAHMHAHGVTHRDLKPANVLFGDDGRPKLADFGLASFEEASRLTRAGDMVGTPLYMAPEQARGRREDVGPACDVYALGVILFETLTGQVPFPGSTTVEVLEQLMNKAPPRPSSLRGSIPRDLEEVCLRAMSKRPGDRYDAAGLAAALDRILAGEQVEEPGLDWRDRRLQVGAGVGTLALLSLLGLVLWPAAPPSQAGPVSPEAGPDAPSTAGDQLASLGWRLRVGQELACQLRVSADVTWAGQQFALARRFGMRWLVEQVEPNAIHVSARFDEVKLQWSGGGDSLSFHSTLSRDADHRCMKLIGKRFKLVFHPATGKVEHVDDLRPLQEEILVGLEGWASRRRYTVPELQGEEMKDLLNTLLHTLPGVEAKPGDVWTRERPPPWTLNKGRGQGPKPLVASFELRRRTADGVWIAWAGQFKGEGDSHHRSERESSGRWNSTASSGMVVSQVTERWESEGRWEGQTHRTSGRASAELSLRPLRAPQ